MHSIFGFHSWFFSQINKIFGLYQSMKVMLSSKLHNHKRKNSKTLYQDQFNQINRGWVGLYLFVHRVFLQQTEVQYIPHVLNQIMSETLQIIQLFLSPFQYTHQDRASDLHLCDPIYQTWKILCLLNSQRVPKIPTTFGYIGDSLPLYCFESSVIPLTLGYWRSVTSSLLIE